MISEKSSISYKFQYLNAAEGGKALIGGTPRFYLDFTTAHQLTGRDTWRRFVNVFRQDCDDADTGWRCEYWGKMMRGAALTYLATGDEELYAVMEETVRDLLTAQRTDGRFSTYSAEKQLNGWDIWGRKYVLTGMMHFYRVCRDEALQKEILGALIRHADALIGKVGNGAGQKKITETSAWWGGVNSSSVLEPMVDLYKLTGEKRFLKFAEYIVSEGGCRDGNLIELARADEIAPYMYPEVKAYETISFFEGLLAYYEVTGKTEYLDIVQKFVEQVAKTDITVIGCSGCTHELFDNSAVKQILHSDIIMQETCVTVTWMRMLARLFLLTGDAGYAARIETSAYNALYGSVNVKMIRQRKNQEDNLLVDPLPFDSYSPLYNNRRGAAVGGFKTLPDGSYYGCCACIAAAGIAVFPLIAAVTDGEGLVFNSFVPGTFTCKTPDGNTVSLVASTTYPTSMEWKAKVETGTRARMKLSLRLPVFCGSPLLTINGESVKIETRSDKRRNSGYIVLDREWENGDEIALTGTFAVRTIRVGDRTAFLRGPLVLARDVQKESAGTDLTEDVRVKAPLRAKVQTPAEGELCRLTLERADGKEPLLLTDYASCGKNWLEKNADLTVWHNLV